MATENVKSTSVTNDDAIPRVPNTSGLGAPARLNVADDYATVAAAMQATSTYRLVRVPSNSKVKNVTFESQAQGAGKFNIGVYKIPADGGGAADDDLFATDVDCASAVQPTNVTNESGSYTPDKRKMPLWQAAGLSADVPSGMLDIVATVHTTDVTTGTGKIGVQVSFAN